MAQQKNPFDMSEMFRAFDPEQMSRMWNPQAMMSMFQPQQPQMFDMDQIIKANQRNFEAMGEANRAAAEAYKDLLDKQMEIFEKLTQAARQQYEWIEDNAGPDTMKAKTAAMNEAVEEALKMMRSMAENARQANAKAAEDMQAQVKDAVKQVESAARKATKG